MALRHWLMGGGMLVLLALLVSSPRHSGFWFVLGAEAILASGYVFGLMRLYRLAKLRRRDVGKD